MSNENYESQDAASSRYEHPKHTVFTDADQTPISVAEPVQPPEPAPPAPASPYATYEPANAQQPGSSQHYYVPSDTYNPQQNDAYMPVSNYVAPSATAALVCGVLSIVLCGSIVFSVVLGIAAIVLGTRHINNFGPDTKAGAGRLLGILGVAIAVIITIGLIVTAVTSSSDNYDDSTWTENAVYSDEATDAVFASTYDATCEAFTHPNDEFESEFREYMDTYYKDLYGYTLTEMGVDLDELYDFMISGTTVELDADNFYAYDDGTANSYPIVYCYDFYLFDTFTSSYMREVGYDGTAEEYGEAFTKGLEEFKKVDPVVTTDDYSAYVTYKKNGDTWEFDNTDDLLTEVEMAYHIYY